MTLLMLLLLISICSLIENGAGGRLARPQYDVDPYRYDDTFEDYDTKDIKDYPSRFSLPVQDANGFQFLTNEDIVKKSSAFNNGADRIRDYRDHEDNFINDYVQCELNRTMLNLREEFGNRRLRFHGFDDHHQPMIRTAACQRVVGGERRVPVPCKQKTDRHNQHLCYVKASHCKTAKRDVFIWMKEDGGPWEPRPLEISVGCECHSEFHYD